ncbi:M14 family metallopeptidase [Flavobacterium sp.]|uniref:M14 family metallopeptidase n=1 Tax=Flavobacterium sp. TaxID=239 RepID=UPI00286B1761|nr:M14 family metallopeptidase [Flavobacterium sp.]
MNFESIAQTNKVPSLSGRYITLESIEPLLSQWNTDHHLKIVGQSVLHQSIYAYTIGHGSTRVLMWSQMHGNESTTTKAVFDFLNFLHSDSDTATQWLSHFTFMMLPMLNPDGAKAYTRENANGIDLNRDAQDLSQPESKILRACFDKFEPHYCFNLHDQRTIYAVGNTNKPATVSFLAPAFNVAREINAVREKAIGVIVAMNDALQQYIPNQVGRFDDAFNLNCVGDTFQSLNVPTILFEAGHFQNDYEREVTRKFIFIALISGLQHIYENVVVDNKTDNYLNIPQNKAVFFDIVYKNVNINYDGIEKNTNFAVHYKEELIDNRLCFNGYFAQIGNLEDAFGHFEFDAKGAVYSDESDNIPKLDAKANFCLDKITKIVNGRINS